MRESYSWANNLHIFVAHYVPIKIDVSEIVERSCAAFAAKSDRVESFKGMKSLIESLSTRLLTDLGRSAGGFRRGRSQPRSSKGEVGDAWSPLDSRRVNDVAAYSCKVAPVTVQRKAYENYCMIK